MPPALWLAAGFVLLILALLLLAVWVLRRHDRPEAPSAAAREVVEQVDLDEGE